MLSRLVTLLIQRIRNALAKLKIQTPSVPKLKMTEFAVGPLEWPERSYLFRTDGQISHDNAKLRSLKMALMENVRQLLHVFVTFDTR